MPAENVWPPRSNLWSAHSQVSAALFYVRTVHLSGHGSVQTIRGFLTLQAKGQQCYLRQNICPVVARSTGPAPPPLHMLWLECEHLSACGLWAAQQMSGYWIQPKLDTVLCWGDLEVELMQQAGLQEAFVCSMSHDKFGSKLYCTVKCTGSHPHCDIQYIQMIIIYKFQSW